MSQLCLGSKQRCALLHCVLFLRKTNLRIRSFLFLIRLVSLLHCPFPKKKSRLWLMKREFYILLCKVKVVCLFLFFDFVFCNPAVGLNQRSLAVGSTGGNFWEPSMRSRCFKGWKWTFHVSSDRCPSNGLKMLGIATWAENSHVSWRHPLLEKPMPLNRCNKKNIDVCLTEG